MFSLVVFNSDLRMGVKSIQLNINELLCTVVSIIELKGTLFDVVSGLCNDCIMNAFNVRAK